MNIFALSTDPDLAARYMCDKHIPKMVVESAQMMASAMLRHGFQPHDMPLTQKGTPYKGGYHHHPCTVWAGDSLSNFEWLSQHAYALCNEFNLRFGTKHACEPAIRSMSAKVAFTSRLKHTFPQSDSRASFAMAMPDEFKRSDGKEVLAYRAYYLSKVFKGGLRPTWAKGRTAPSWWNESAFSWSSESIHDYIDKCVAGREDGDGSAASELEEWRARRATAALEQQQALLEQAFDGNWVWDGPAPPWSQNTNRGNR